MTVVDTSGGFPFKILINQLYFKTLIAMKRKFLPDYLRALLLKMLHGGPAFSKEADLWDVGHGSEKIHIPILRRYTMYKKGVNPVISFFLITSFL